MDFEKLGMAGPPPERSYYIFDLNGFLYIWQYRASRVLANAQWLFLLKLDVKALQLFGLFEAVAGKIFDLPCQIYWGCPPEFEKMEAEKW